MVAGMILSLMENSNLNTALQYGVACGTAATIHPGTGLSDKKFAEEAFQLIIAASAKDGR
jgi:6-phosphofructokinase 2